MKSNGRQARNAPVESEERQTAKFFVDASGFRAWLQSRATVESELIVGFYKVDSGLPSMSWSESVDEALCFGWIDGVRKRIDSLSYSIRFTPRKDNSIWSAVNIAKMEKLIAEGRATDIGKKAFAFRTEHKSRIYAYEQEAVASLSTEELQSFKSQKSAWLFFDATPPGYKKVILHWLSSAKRAETRRSRFATLVRASASGLRLR